MANKTEAQYPYKHYYSTPERNAQKLALGEAVPGWKLNTKTKRVLTGAAKLAADIQKAGGKLTDFARIKTSSYLKYNYGAKTYTNVLLPIITESGQNTEETVAAFIALGLKPEEFMFFNTLSQIAEPLSEIGIKLDKYVEDQEVATASKIKAGKEQTASEAEEDDGEDPGYEDGDE